MGVVTVVLEKMSHLKDTDGAMNHPDPYVTFHLEEDNIILDKNLGKQQSSTKKCTCNPTYNETFTFNNVDSLKNVVLMVRVFDEDFGRDDAMGKLRIKLDEEALTPGEFKNFNQKLEKSGKGMFSRDARIELKIKYDQ
ncbi:C2 domain containing protein [Nitzschia inconspicua]|uniref:C2 domain containing protein n=1 Tax=Nitzschia inconspicua TaxID=303405 RepID=A0A9K3KBM3_9STRA|nr:C2 domain containing protein [Nitzschia inconspicua]